MRILIEAELMRRSPISDKAEWVDRYALPYRNLFNDPENKENFLRMYKEEPEALYMLLQQVLEKGE